MRYYTASAWEANVLGKVDVWLTKHFFFIGYGKGIYKHLVHEGAGQVN